VATELNLPPYFAAAAVAAGDGAPITDAAVGVAGALAPVDGVGTVGAKDEAQPTIPQVVTPCTLAPLA
jgi:hypothetical protein